MPSRDTCSNQTFPLPSAAPEREKPPYKTLQHFFHQIFLSYFLTFGGWEGSYSELQDNSGWKGLQEVVQPSLRLKGGLVTSSF